MPVGGVGVVPKGELAGAKQRAQRHGLKHGPRVDGVKVRPGSHGENPVRGSTEGHDV
jgi:hypothetical protein